MLYVVRNVSQEWYCIRKINLWMPSCYPNAATFVALPVEVCRSCPRSPWFTIWIIWPSRCRFAGQILQNAPVAGFMFTHALSESDSMFVWLAAALLYYIVFICIPMIGLIHRAWSCARKYRISWSTKPSKSLRNHCLRMNRHSATPCMCLITYRLTNPSESLPRYENEKSNQNHIPSAIQNALHFIVGSIRQVFIIFHNVSTNSYCSWWV